MMTSVNDLGLHPDVIAILLSAHLQFSDVKAKIIQATHARLELIPILTTDDEFSGDLLPEGVVTGAKPDSGDERIYPLVKATA